MTSPDGVQWRVGRRWLTRRVGWSWRRRGDIASEGLFQFLSTPSDLGDLGSGEGLLWLAAAVAAVLILVPILFFGIELIIVGALLAAGLLSRVVLRRPWLIEARSSDPLTPGRAIEWQVRGWRRSSRLIDQVASDLADGREPPQPSLPS